MKKIIISRFFSEDIYKKNKKMWENSSNAFIEVEEMTTQELVDLTKVLLKKIPDSFSFTILSELVENENLPVALVKEIFFNGNISCKVASCLRNNLDEELFNLCNNSNEEIVKEHFRQKNNIHP
jgi:hypothetical protein